MHVKHLYQIIKKPVATEKFAQCESDFYKKITIEVDISSTKRQIIEAFKFLFNLQVLKVNTIIVRGKKKRVGKIWGRESNWKKAVVLLKKNEESKNLEFFDNA